LENRDLGWSALFCLQSALPRRNWGSGQEASTVMPADGLSKAPWRSAVVVTHFNAHYIVDRQPKTD
jgi:hypothetical protein